MIFFMWVMFLGGDGVKDGGKEKMVKKNGSARYVGRRK